MFVDPKMCSVVVIVAHVFVDQTFQMALIQYNHMVEKIAAAIADPTLRDAVLPWGAKAGSFGLDAETLHGVNHFFIEVRPAIKN